MKPADLTGARIAVSSARLDAAIQMLERSNEQIQSLLQDEDLLARVERCEAAISDLKKSTGCK